MDVPARNAYGEVLTDCLLGACNTFSCAYVRLRVHPGMGFRSE